MPKSQSMPSFTTRRRLVRPAETPSSFSGHCVEVLRDGQVVAKRALQCEAEQVIASMRGEPVHAPH